MAPAPRKAPQIQPAAQLIGMLDRDSVETLGEQIAREAGRSLGIELGRISPAMRASLIAALTQGVAPPASESWARLSQRVDMNTQSPPSVLRGVAAGRDRTSPAPARSPRRRAIRMPLGERIARRVTRRHRSAAVSFLNRAGFDSDVNELLAIETRLAEGTRRGCMHAAFGARTLMQAIANSLFPPSPKTRLDRHGRRHSIGPDDHKNRLIAYVEENLAGQLEGHEFRAFTGTMDLVMRWTGSGPHGTHGLEDAEHMYTRMLDALTVIAKAHEAA